jgi:hypothetical protein
MEAILKYNMDDPDDERKHKLAVISFGLALQVWEFLYNTRKDIEYKIDEGAFKTQSDVLDETYKRLYDLLEEKNINIDSLIT